MHRSYLDTLGSAEGGTQWVENASFRMICNSVLCTLGSVGRTGVEGRGRRTTVGEVRNAAWVRLEKGRPFVRDAKRRANTPENTGQSKPISTALKIICTRRSIARKHDSRRGKGSLNEIYISKSASVFSTVSKMLLVG